MVEPLRLERQIAVPSTPDEVWRLFWDIPALASCIPGCTGAREGAEPHRYVAGIEVRVGRFRVEFELDIIVLEAQERAMVKARAQGRDRRTRSAMVSDLVLRLASHEPNGTLVEMVNDLQVYGRLGSMGHKTVQRRSDELMDEFVHNLRARLASAPAAGRLP
jgi:carbon monoxide dehydrogenase subunit G